MNQIEKWFTVIRIQMFSLKYILNTLPPLRAKSFRLALYSIIGFCLGFLILHPFSMMVFQLSGKLNFTSPLTAILHSFSISMWLMWIYYSLLGGVSGFCSAVYVNHIRQLEGLLKVCAWCGRIRDNDTQDATNPTWRRLDAYLMEHGVQETHGVCPDCKASFQNHIHEFNKSVNKANNRNR